MLEQGNPFGTAAQVEELVARMPAIGQTLVNLHRRLHDTTADLEALHSRASLEISDTSTPSQQPMPFEAAKPEIEVEKEDADLASDDLEIDVDEEAEENPDDEVDLGGDDDIGVPGAAGDDEEV